MMSIARGIVVRVIIVVVAALIVGFLYAAVVGAADFGPVKQPHIKRLHQTDIKLLHGTTALDALIAPVQRS